MINPVFNLTTLPQAPMDPTMIDEEVLAEIKRRIDLAEIVGAHVGLKKVGRSFKGLCPFHAEKSPSFHVHPERGYYYCFGCQASGDVFRFTMHVEGLTFPEAVVQLGERTGVEVKTKNESPAKRQRKSARDELFDIMNHAAAFYEAELNAEKQKQILQSIFEERALSIETLSLFRLGYAPLAWDGLAKHLTQNNIDLIKAEKLGLISQGKKGGYYDRFRHRLMFPVRDAHGRVVAFSGRKLPAGPEHERLVGQGKYINSPETPIYTKGRTLFGLYESKKHLRRGGDAILCEGNFDVLSFFEAGHPQAIAPLGTALTSMQCELLKKYSSEVVIAFDGDSAGVKAAEKSFPLLSDAKLRVHIVSFPPGNDPDTFRRSEGNQGIDRLLERKQDMLNYLIDHGADKAGGNPHAKSDAIGELAPMLAAVSDSMARGFYVERVAKRFGIRDLKALRQQLNQALKKTRTSNASKARQTQQNAENHRSESDDDQPPESQLPTNRLILDTLGTIVDHPELLLSDAGQQFLSLIRDPNLTKILDSLALSAKNPDDLSGVSNVAQVIAAGPLRRWLNARLVNPETNLRDAEALLKRGVSEVLRKRTENEDLPALKQRILEALRRGDDEKAKELSEKRAALAKQALGKNEKTDT